MTTPRMPSFQECARWADAALREIGGPLGVGLPEATEPVWTDTLAEVWHDHGDQGVIQ
jgi:hypothetical protein